MDDRDLLIALLVERLGGDVTIAVHELENPPDELECLRDPDPTRLAYHYRTRRTIEGEVVEPSKLDKYARLVFSPPQLPSAPGQLSQLITGI